MGVFRTILIILVIYYLIKGAVKLFSYAFSGSGTGKSSSRGPRREGDVTILNRGKKAKGNDQRLGDYVDYEEID
jgi:hypothetical protein